MFTSNTIKHATNCGTLLRIIKSKKRDCLSCWHDPQKACFQHISKEIFHKDGYMRTHCPRPYELKQAVCLESRSYKPLKTSTICWGMHRVSWRKIVALGEGVWYKRIRAGWFDSQSHIFFSCNLRCSRRYTIATMNRMVRYVLNKITKDYCCIWGFNKICLFINFSENLIEYRL